jgi:hypothetical protein
VADAGVELEMNSGGAAQAQALPDLARMKPAARSRARAVFLAAARRQAGVVHPRVLQVGLTCTRVMVTNPTPGSCSSRAMIVVDFRANLIGHTFGSRTLRPWISSRELDSLS